MRNRGYGWLAAVAVLALVFGMLGGCTAQPAPAPASERAVAQNTTDSMWVTKEFTSEGTNTFSGTVLGASPLVFEGATADAYETTLAITDPTSSDKTITFPNSTGTVALNPYGASIEFEGATANDYETTLTVVDPTTPDKTITLPNVTGTVHVNEATQPLIAQSATVGGGYFSTGCTTSTAGVLQCTGGITSDGAILGNTGAFTSTLTATGSAALNGGITVDTTNFTVSGSTGAVSTASTLAVTGASTLTGGATSAADVTLSADATGGNAGAKTELIGLPRIKLLGGGQGTNPASQTIALVDDSPDGEFAPVDASVVESLDTTYYKYGSASYKAAFAAGATAGDGFLDANLGAAAAWDDMESAGLLIRSSVAITAGSLTLVLTDDGGARTYDIPAVATANQWTWVEVNIATGDLSAVSDVAVLLSAGGAVALGAFDLWVDIGYVWDSVDEEALGVAIQQDGVLGVINTESGASLVELTDYVVHYESGSDFIVYITDQSAADIAVLAAY